METLSQNNNHNNNNGPEALEKSDNGPNGLSLTFLVSKNRALIFMHKCTFPPPHCLSGLFLTPG